MYYIIDGEQFKWFDANGRSVNPRAKNPQAENPRVQMPGEFPVDLGIQPLRFENLTESNPLKSRLSARGLTVQSGSRKCWVCLSWV